MSPKKNSILILSIENDPSTSHVINWLNFYNKKFDRINENEILFSEIELGNDVCNAIVVNDKLYNLTNYTSYWYRRGDFNLYYKSLRPKNEASTNINAYNKENRQDVQSYLHDFLQLNIKSINNFNDNNINKLNELTYAKQSGLLIPNTLITSNKKSLLDFSCTNKKIIVKPIKYSLNFKIDNIAFSHPTLLLEKEIIETFPDFFMPIKVQNYIDKAFELRIFYLNNKFYASAIFSQNDNTTKIDFRNYNIENPNRVIPFSLPYKIKQKLIKLMNHLNLVSGSLDMIVTKDGNYVFLEVNPIGQFTQVSLPCNYNIEKQIALYLS